MFPSKRKIYAGLAGIGITLGAAGLANAASSTTAPTPAAVTAAAATGAAVATTPTDPTTLSSNRVAVTAPLVSVRP